MAIVIFEEKDHGIGKIIDMQEFVHGTARAPNSYVLCSLLFRFMKLADQRGQHAARGKIKISFGP